MGIIAIISTIALSMFYVTISSYERSNSLLELEANGQRVLDVLEREIRGSGSVVGYDNFAGCTTNCDSSWLIVQDKSISTQCYYYGLVSTGVGEPDLWTDNGYVFREEITCPADLSGYDGTPGEDARALSNRNQSDPRNGINVADLNFKINRPSGAPANAEILLEMRQGVTGNGQLPPAESRLSITLETTTSLR